MAIIAKVRYALLHRAMMRSVQREKGKMMRICGNCDFNDGCTYTSLPPKYKCTLTGKFHFGDALCDVNVPVVQCKDCKWQGDDEHCPVCNCCGREELPSGNWYCADGERRT